MGSSFCATGHFHEDSSRGRFNPEDEMPPMSLAQSERSKRMKVDGPEIEIFILHCKVLQPL